MAIRLAGEIMASAELEQNMLEREWYLAEKHEFLRHPELHINMTSDDAFNFLEYYLTYKLSTPRRERDRAFAKTVLAALKERMHTTPRPPQTESEDAR